LIEVRFLIVRSAFGSINSDDFTSNQVSIFKKKKQREQILIPMDSKVGYTMVVGYDAHKSHCNSIREHSFLTSLRPQTI
jgi:hypothetical protein